MFHSMNYQFRHSSLYVTEKLEARRPRKHGNSRQGVFVLDSMLTILNIVQNQSQQKGREICFRVSRRLKSHLRLLKGLKLHVFLNILLDADENGWSRVSMTLLEAQTGYNTTTLKRTISTLCKLRIEGRRVLLAVHESGVTGPNCVNHYLIFPSEAEVIKYEGRKIVARLKMIKSQ